MKMKKVSNCDVMIIGAGPTGLMLALELARYGVSFKIIDKKNNVSDIMKATAISSVALEGFDDLGFAEPFTQNGVFTIKGMDSTEVTFEATITEDVETLDGAFVEMYYLKRPHNHATHIEIIE